MPFDDGLERALLLLAQAGAGLELQAQVVVGAALVLVEEELVGAGGESEGKAAKDVEGGGRRSSFVAAHLGDVDAGPLARACWVRPRSLRRAASR